MRVIGYGRASTDEQRITCKAQEETILKAVEYRSLADWKDCEYIGFLADEGVSSTIPLFDRPQGQRILLNLTAGDTIVVTALDRLARNTLEFLQSLETFDEAGINLVILEHNWDTTTPSGRLALQILAAMAEFERNQIAKRTSDALQWKKRNKKVYTRCTPLGWRKGKNGDIIPDKATRVLGSKVAKLKDERGMSIRQILKSFKALRIHWPDSCKSGTAGKPIESTDSIHSLYQRHVLGWPMMNRREVNRAYASEHASPSLRQQRRERRSSPS